MNYKSYLKNNEIITISLRIIKNVIVDKLAINDISFRYSMYRNLVRNILNYYYFQASPELKSMIENKVRFTDYSKGKSFIFGLQFLVLVLSHLKEVIKLLNLYICILIDELNSFIIVKKVL